MNIRKGILLLAVFAALVPGSAGTLFAYRPLGTEDAGVAGKGVAQLELSWDYVRWDGNDRDYVLTAVPVYGITERAELSAEIPYVMHRSGIQPLVEGGGDVNMVMKYLVMPENGEHPAFTVKGVVKLDSGDHTQGLGSGDRDYSVFAVSTKTLGVVSIHGHLGYTWIGKSNDPNLRNIYLYGLALDYGITDALHIVGELDGNRYPYLQAIQDPRIALLGMTLKFSDRFTVDVGIRKGLTATAPEWSTTAGVSMTY